MTVALRLAALALLLVACADEVPPRGAPPAPTTPPVTTPPVTTPPATPDDDEADPGRVRADVDGDGTPDTASLVEEGVKADDTWRFGVRVVLSSLGARTAWEDHGVGANDGQSLIGAADVDGDGRSEVGVTAGTTASAAISELVTFAGDRLVLLRAPELWTGQQDGLRGWGCADGLLYVTVARRAEGTVTYYRLAGGRFARVRAETVRWRAGETPPAPFGDRVDCGTMRV